MEGREIAKGWHRIDEVVHEFVDLNQPVMVDA
mgnify:CR=1 FL=1